MSYTVSGVQSAQSVHGMSGASQSMPLYSKISDLYSQIDTSGSGSISQGQFQTAFNTLNPPSKFQAAGADAIWSQLKNSSSGSVKKNDFVQGIAKLSASLPNATAVSSSSPSAAQSVAQSLSSILGSSSIDYTV